MLGNNLNMMSFEMTKICKTYKINDFNKDKISTYPEEAQSRLTSASTCVEKAEQTLTEFKEFLKTEKYKEWNDEQVCLTNILVVSIGFISCLFIQYTMGARIPNKFGIRMVQSCSD